MADGGNHTEAKHFVLLGPMYPYRGGIAHFLGEMERGLQARGHRTTGITFSRQFPASLFPGKTQYESEEAPASTKALRLLDTLRPGSWFRTASYIEGLEPDAVIFQYWMPFFGPAFGTVARRLKRRPIKKLAIVHNAIPHERRPGDFSLGRYFLNACDGLLVMSTAVARDLETLGIDTPQHRVEHPVYDVFGERLPQSEARSRLGLPQEAPVVLFFGFIRRYKGLMDLLHSLPKVLTVRPDVRLVVAGECYEDDAAYRAYVRDHGLEEVVQWHLTYIPTEDVAVYFCAADVVVQPYRTATQSGVAQIAYHFERPLIVTDVGGLAEIVPHEKAGLVVPPCNPDALAQAIVRFFAEDLGARFQEGLREVKARYSWDRLFEALEEWL